MASIISLDPARPILRLTYSGEVMASELKTSFDESVRMVKESGVCSVLTNLQELTGGHGLFDLFAIIEMLQAAGVPTNFKEAVVLTPGNPMFSRATFYETACLNRGYNVRLFGSVAEAENWLVASA